MTKQATALARAEAATAPKLRVVGDKVVQGELKSVQPNSWNPNRMTPFLRESLKHGLQVDGWLLSQSLLVWGSDERKRIKNIIIDGEHRHGVALELGFKKGPMVFLHGLPEAEAKKLTIKMNQKRGDFDGPELGALLRDIQNSLPGVELTLDLGIDQEELMAHLMVPESLLPGEVPEAGNSTPGEVPSGQASHVRMVQLFFNKEQHAEFDGLVKRLAADFGTKDVSATVMEAMRAAHPTKKSRS